MEKQKTKRLNKTLSFGDELGCLTFAVPVVVEKLRMMNNQ